MKESLVPNSTLYHYLIIKKLGSGGMGEVYLARDTKLERSVAIKLLPATYTEDTDRVRRFVQEAKAASALNHPNIIVIHESASSTICILLSPSLLKAGRCDMTEEL